MIDEQLKLATDRRQQVSISLSASALALAALMVEENYRSYPSRSRLVDTLIFAEAERQGIELSPEEA